MYLYILCSRYAASAVWSIFNEASTKLEYNDTTITSAIPGVTVTVGNDPETTINQIPTCTRFQADGVGIRIHGILFDQSLCNLTTVTGQTPILFSGAFAMNARVYNITVRDASVAVAVLGGDSIVYTFQPLISANGMVIHDVRFEYTEYTNLPIMNR